MEMKTSTGKCYEKEVLWNKSVQKTEQADLYLMETDQRTGLFQLQLEGGEGGGDHYLKSSMKGMVGFTSGWGDKHPLHTMS